MPDQRLHDHWLPCSWVSSPVMNIISRGTFVGGWQLISMFVHFYSDWFMTKGGKRNLYHRVVLAVLCIWGISFAYAPAPAAAALCHAHCRADHGDHLYFHLFY